MDWTTRYATSLSQVWTRQHKLDLEHRVELALLKALGDMGRIPVEAYTTAKAAIDEGKVTLERTLAIESETHHDIMAMVKAISEQCGEMGGFIHYGATSQDINDTVLALQLRDCVREVKAESRAVRRELTRLAQQHRALAAIGRTHGQHAVPVTIGLKFANFLYELATAEAFLDRVQLLGKFSGAVGTFAAVGGTMEIQQRIMAILELQPAPISTQVITRLHLCDLAFAIASIVGALERIGKEIRNLQRTEIGELCEGFGKKQVGSSTMPQKRNPHKSERICGLSRVVRAQLQPLMETVALEHERDLTNSGLERVTLPTSTVLCHYLLTEMRKVLAGLRVNEEAVRRNLFAGNGKQLAERIMIALVERLGRQEAHELLRVHSAADDFPAALRADARIAEVLGEAELELLLDPTTYIGRAPEVVDEVCAQFGVQAEGDEAAEGAAAAAAGGAAE